MRKIFTLLFSTVLISQLSFGQAAIPNGDFENFNAGGALDPTGWSTSDDLVTGLGLGLASPGSVVQDTNAANVYSGHSSVLLSTKAVAIPTLGNLTFAGSMSLGSYGFSISNFQVTLGGTAYTDRPDSIVFAYKYNLPVGANDSAIVTVNLSKATAHDGTIVVGSTKLYLYYTSGFAIAKAKINYFSAQNPDTLKIQAQSSATLFMGADGAQLWLDSLHFSGLDTAFKVYLTPDALQKKCVGDTIQIRTDDIAGDSYAWYFNGTLLPDSVYKIRTGTAGNYSLVVTHNGTSYNSDTIPMIVNPLPSVSLTGPEDTVCDNGSTLQLSGGSPAGGVYSGRGIAAGVLNPANAPLGNNTIRYTYTDSNGCRASATATLIYVAGCSLGIEILQSDAQISIYPNPAFDVVYVKGNIKILGATANVYDIQGRLIKVVGINGEQTAISLINMSAGLYSVIISDTNNKMMAKAKVVLAK